MKFKKYLQAVNQLAIDNPECLDYDVKYASDDEGNWYGDAYLPELVYINEDNECTHPDDWDDYDITGPNSVLIN